MTDIAIAHDQFRTMGGAERVAVEIARTFDCPIYVMRVEDDVPPDDVDVRSVSSNWGEWCMRRHWMVQDAYQMLAWQHVSELYDYDTVILTKNNPAWFVPHVDSQTVVRYCHSPPRSMYDQFHRRGKAKKTRPLYTIQRLLYQHTIPYADRWLCNSDVVKRRVRAYADPASADVDVVYPPVEVGKTSPDLTPTKDYLFYIGRLAVNKRIPLIREVAEERDEKIVVAGDGDFRDELVDDSPDNLEYLGYISEREKWRRLSEAKATLMLAENEDFGIVPIESMAAGTPVIGSDEGFTKQQIVDQANGVVCEPDLESVSRAVDTIYNEGVVWSEDEIAAFADRFSVSRFRNEMSEKVAETECEVESKRLPEWKASSPQLEVGHE